MTGAGGKVGLTFPAGAVTAETEITVEAVTAVAENGGLMEGTSYDFGPDGLTFAEPVDLMIEYDESDLPEGTVEGSLAIHKQVGEAWELIEGAVVNTENNTVTAPISSFSVYGVVVDPCSNNPPISMGASVEGTLAEGDCLFGEEKYQDQYQLTLGGMTAFNTTQSSVDYTPFTGTFIHGGARVSGVINDDGTATGLHIFPGGSYDVFASSWGDAEGGGFFTGDYTLSVTPGSTNPTGCVPFIFVRSGVSVDGEIGPDDCEDPFDGEPEVTRWVDTYVVLLTAGQTVLFTVTSDFPMRASVWTGSTLVEIQDNITPGTTATFSATATEEAYYSINPISAEHESAGSYTMTATSVGGSEAPASVAPKPVAPLPQRGFIRQ